MSPPKERLVSRLCALLSRQEVRDLADLRALLETGLDLERAVADAPKQDAGFSPLTLAWVRQGFPLPRLAAAEQWPEPEGLEAFRLDLVRRLLELSHPPA